MREELDEARQRIAHMERELSQAQQTLEDFTHSVSHDLRAPVRHVKAYLNIVREDLGPNVEPAILAHLQTASEAATQITHLMDGLLELSRIGRTELQLSDVDLQRLLSDVRHGLDQDAQDRVVEWDLPTALPPVHGDIALLGQMFGHLLGNALKFTRGREVARITVVAHAQADGWVELEIRDNGVGFDPRFQDRLFRPFQRLHSSKQFEGIGIGLALARRVVERHGGTIRAHCEAGQGCGIFITLPQSAPDAATTGLAAP